MSESVLRLVSRLEAYHPDLIFNLAEGHHGRFREAFYPALFHELGFPYTGSDAYTLALTLDKHITKLLLRANGVRTPEWQFLRSIDDLRMSKLRLPVIVKPNYEGSSKGITQDSIAETSRDLRRKVQDALMHYPEGILVEEFIAGKDVTVPFLAAIENDYGGVLSPSEYVVEGRSMHGRPYSIYDYELKNTYDEDVSILAPASASSSSLGEMRRSAHDAFHLVACQDLGRVDFRLTWDGVPYLLEINPLPSLERGAAIYAAAEVEGLSSDGVIASIMLSACERR